jgi:hypothetical protein
LDLSPQLRQTTLNGFPDQWYVNPKIKVDKAVPHPGHLFFFHGTSDIVPE